MEFITDEAGEAAPRLAQLRPGPDQARDLGDQLSEAMRQLAALGYAHGDLSPYNVLVSEGRAVVIDVPQIVDLIANPQGSDFLLRDCRAVCTWLVRHGVPADEHDWFAALVAEAWG